MLVHISPRRRVAETWRSGEMLMIAKFVSGTAAIWALTEFQTWSFPGISGTSCCLNGQG